MLPASLAACALAWWSLGPARSVRRAGERSDGGRPRSSASATCAAIAVLFYSSFLTHPAASWSRFAPPPPTSQRGVDPADHVHPWHFYLGLLAWSSSGGLRWTEALVLVLAAVGAVTAWTPARSGAARATFWRRYLTGQRRPHPGDLLRHPVQDALEPPPLLRRDDRRRRHRGLGAGAGDGLPGGPRRCWRRARDRLPATWAGRRGGRRSSTRRTRAIRTSMRRRSRMRSAWRRASAIWPPCIPTASGMLVMVIAPPHEQWPLPWYLRTMPHVGYWADATDVPDLTAPVIVAVDGQRGDARRRARRSLRLRVLRRPARSARDALRRARALGSLPGPGRRAAATAERSRSYPVRGAVQLRIPAARQPRPTGEGDRTMANEKTPPDVSRRQFVGTVAATAAGLTIVPRHVLGAGFQAPSDTVNVAVVGYATATRMGTNNLLNVDEDRQHRRALRLRRERGRQGRAGCAQDDADRTSRRRPTTRTSA